MVMRIKELREKVGFSQQELANRMGVLQSAVCNWENEVALPRSRQLPELARVLNFWHWSWSAPSTIFSLALRRQRFDRIFLCFNFTRWKEGAPCTKTNQMPSKERGSVKV